MLQLDLVSKPRNSGGDVSDDVIARIPNKLAALKLCMEVSGLDDKQICSALDIEQAQLSRIRKGEMHFPPNKEDQLMTVCGNEIPLRWSAWKRGYELKRFLSAVEAENLALKSQLSERDRDLETIKRFVRETGR